MILPRKMNSFSTVIRFWNSDQYVDKDIRLDRIDKLKDCLIFEDDKVDEKGRSFRMRMNWVASLAQKETPVCFGYQYGAHSIARDFEPVSMTSSRSLLAFLQDEYSSPHKTLFSSVKSSWSSSKPKEK